MKKIDYKKCTIFSAKLTLQPGLKHFKVNLSQGFSPENYSALIKKGLPIEAKVSSYKDKVFEGEIDFVSSRINADTRSLLSRVKIEKNLIQIK